MVVVLALWLAACAHPTEPPPAAAVHLPQAVAADALPGDIPAIVETGSKADQARWRPLNVVVRRADALTLLTSLANDTGVALDVHPEVSGQVSLHALGQTLPQLLERICRQINARFELSNGLVRILPDGPYLVHYRVDYVNLDRQMKSSIAVNTSISQDGQNNPAAAGLSSSATRIDSSSNHRFWSSLEKSVRDLLHETDKILPPGASEGSWEYSSEGSRTAKPAKRPTRNSRSSAPPPPQRASPSGQASSESEEGSSHWRWQTTTVREAALVIAHPESGLLSVRANSEQHDKVKRFIKAVQQAALRQVLIEATIIEVELNDGYQQGIEWSRLRSDGSGFAVTPASGGGINAAQPFVVRLINRASPLDVSAIVNVLQSFGQTRVLSSPRLAVINNHTALLKVVENHVYFSVRADTVNQGNTLSSTVVTTEPHSVAVGLTLSITPFVSPEGMVTLNVRPSISSVSALKIDPNPSIPSHLRNYVPQIRTREIESVMRLVDGEIAVLGGLMSEEWQNDVARVPVLGDIPVLGEVLTRRERNSKKNELVILLRPRISETTD